MKFFSRKSPVVDIKSLAEPTAEEFALFTGGLVSSTAVGLATAMTVPAVASAVHLLSSSIAALKLNVERKDGDAWVTDTDHPVATLLDGDVNDFTSSFEWVRDVIAGALTSDKGSLSHVNRVSAEVREVTAYEPSHFQVDYSADGRREPSFRINNRPTPGDEVVFVRGPFTRCPVTLASESIGVAKEMERHAGRLFRAGARPGGVIESPKAVGDEGMKKMIAAWRKAHEGSDNSGKTAVLFDGASFKTLSFSSVDSQFLQLWKFIILEVARAFRVPPQLLFDFDRATWNNAEQAGKEWLASLEFWMRPMEAAMRRGFFSREERATYRVKFERDDFTNVDLVSRATAASSLISSRALNPNEARTLLLDLPPYQGGETFANPNTGASQPRSTPAEKTSPPDQSKPNKEPGDDA
ncbi:MULTISPECIES: phage portal protein [Agrobacterium]|uniref:Phage portal protein n=1 Tax=Agrobacterium tumefaciens TaxID=358 RepID=A0AAE6B8G5_AGRTU|nr:MULTISPECIES: phage portal protein [Agrobacterium]QCL72718.1 phage portal protein [Agrobacterium tumefaciens]QCL78293.1 phage portal protein [Agrobacterium tumefaciens]CUX15265.1 Phage lambdaBa02, DNA replication protein [Agrobacterium sp. NCPPB 925]